MTNQIYFKMPWQDERLIEWVRRTPPTWANYQILNWTNFYNRSGGHDFQTFTTSVEHDRGVIEMNDVIGQWEHYAGQTWLEALLEPKYKAGKMRSTIQLFDDKGSYYFDEKQKNDISYSTLDGNSWFSTQGNHRTVIAKFGLAMAEAKTSQHFCFHSMRRTRYTVDWNTLELYVSLLETIKTFELPISIILQRHKMYEGGSGPTTQEYFEPVIFVTDGRHDRRRHLYSHLDTLMFRQYAEWVIESKGKLLRVDKWKYFLQRTVGSRGDALFYPGSQTDSLTGHTHFSQQLKKKWKASSPQLKTQQQILDLAQRTKSIPSWTS